ncbi:MAG: hypothetical protein OMOMHJEC_02971 [Xanthomonadales bacterium]|nr:hypothetical protein [Xanthomonadales bacterium]
MADSPKQDRPRAQRQSFATIAAAALASVDAVLSRWLPEGKREGHEWTARNPTRADNRAGSFRVNLKSGRWSDFATGDRGGDLVSLVAYLDGCTQGTAADALAVFLGIQSGTTDAPKPAKAAKPAAESSPASPVPTDAPPAPAAHSKHGRPATVWVYRDSEGRELVRVCRFDKPGGKDVLPLSCWRDPGGLRWHWRALPEPRPLYGLDRLAERPAAPVLVTEGEKDADGAAALLPGFAVVTSPGGARSAAKADWAPLRGRRVLVWPDGDAPGAAYAADVARLAKAAGALSVAIVKPEDLAALRPAERAAEPMPDGWGAADAAPAGIPTDALAAALDALQAPAATKPGARRAKAPQGREGGSSAPRAGFVLIGPDDHRGLRPGVYWCPVGSDRATGEAVEGEPQFICSPLRVEAKTRDAAGGEWGRLLTWTDAEGRAHTWAMPASMTARGGDELREHLLSEGLEIATDPNRRRRLADYIMGAELDRFARCVARTGWHGGVFVLPDRTIGDTGAEPVILQTGAGDGTKLATAGTLDDWRASVALPCAGNSRLVFALSLGFAAVCLGLCGAEGGGFHLRGRSSAGKSTALAVAASIFGPAAPDGYVRQWKATDNSLESVAALHSDLLLCLDEIGQLEARSAAGVAYLLANGAGKSRARRDGSLRAPATWRVLFLSNGEIGLGDLMTEAGGRARAGMEVRVVDIPADAGAGLGLFDHVPEGQTPGAFADALRAAVRKHHGTALLAYLEALAADPDGMRAYLVRYIGTFADELAGSSAAGQVRRVAQRFALVAAAGVLASHAGVTGWDSEEAPQAVRRCFADWLAARPAGRGESEPADMLAAVRHFLEQNGEARFAGWDRGEDDRAPRTLARCGWRRKSDTGQEFLIYPESFRQEVCKGFDAREVARVLARCGALQPEGDSMTRTVRLPSGEKARVYRVLPTIWEVEP